MTCKYWDYGLCYHPAITLEEDRGNGCIGIKKCKYMKQDKIKQSLVAVAEELSKNHPSKDCRFFAESVFKFLTKV